MAIILLGKSNCSVCDDILQKGEVILGFSHFITDSAHPLWRFSDSGMHKDCFATWEHAEDFRSEFNSLYRMLAPSHRLEMLADGTVVKFTGESNS